MPAPETGVPLGVTADVSKNHLDSRFRISKRTGRRQNLHSVRDLAHALRGCTKGQARVRTPRASRATVGCAKQLARRLLRQKRTGLRPPQTSTSREEIRVERLARSLSHGKTVRQSERAMVTAQSNGDCNVCHTEARDKNALGRLMAP